MNRLADVLLMMEVAATDFDRCFRRNRSSKPQCHARWIIRHVRRSRQSAPATFIVIMTQIDTLDYPE